MVCGKIAAPYTKAYVMKISSNMMLLILLAAAVGVYLFVVNGCALTCSRKDKFDSTEPKDACGYLAQDGYSKDFVGSCYDYTKICGRGSGAAEALNMAEMFETFDAKAGEVAYAAEVAKVTADRGMCTPPMPCGMIPDPVGQTYTYNEDTGQYSLNPPLKVQTPCPAFLGCGDVDSSGAGVCQ